jgi:NAD(P)-dependent dehydrogenase (short-subunit alcohol dehydrogenase family)
VAAGIRAHGGMAEAAPVDAMDKAAVDAHADRVVAAAGSIDVSFNAVAVLRSNFTPETYPAVTDEQLAPLLKDTLLGRLPRLADLAGTAVYLASDGAGAISGAMVNLSCGAIID